MSPYDELTELRSVLSTQEIAEVTGLRRETLARARADSRFQRRTQKALDDLYLVIAQLRPLLSGDLRHVAAVLRRPQPVLAQHSIAELLREGKVEVVLDHLGSAPSRETDQLENFKLAPSIQAGLEASEEMPDPSGRPIDAQGGDAGVPALLATDPGLASRLDAIEELIRDRFDQETVIERQIITEATPDSSEVLYLRVRSGMSFDEEIDRLTDLLSHEDGLLGPVMDRLTIGFL
jgi:hypothetical protein